MKSTAADASDYKGRMVKRLKAAYEKTTKRENQKRLHILIDLNSGELTADKVAKKHGTSRRTVFRYQAAYRSKGVKGLFICGKTAFHEAPCFSVELKKKMVTEIRWGRLKTPKKALAWLKEQGFRQGKHSIQCVYAAIRRARKVAAQEKRDGVRRGRLKASWEK